MRLVPECASELLGADDCAFAVAVASVAFGAEVSPMANPRPQPPPHNPLPPLDLDKWCGERLVRKDREMFAAKVLSFVQVGAATRRKVPAFNSTAFQKRGVDMFGIFEEPGIKMGVKKL